MHLLGCVAVNYIRDNNPLLVSSVINPASQPQCELYYGRTTLFWFVNVFSTRRFKVQGLMEMASKLIGSGWD
jgi:hypothetical protein